MTYCSIRNVLHSCSSCSCSVVPLFLVALFRYLFIIIFNGTKRRSAHRRWWVEWSLSGQRPQALTWPSGQRRPTLLGPQWAAPQAMTWPKANIAALFRYLFIFFIYYLFLFLFIFFFYFYYYLLLFLTMNLRLFTIVKESSSWPKAHAFNNPSCGL